MEYSATGDPYCHPSGHLRGRHSLDLFQIHIFRKRVRIPLARTLKGNEKQFELAGSEKKG